MDLAVLKRRDVLLDLLLLAIVAGLFRFVLLGSLPVAPPIDIAYNGIDARDLLEGRSSIFQLFFPDNFGRESGIVWLTALSIKLFGYTNFALRFPGALAGVLLTLAIYLVTRTYTNRRIAFIAGILVAVSFWDVMISRHGFRAGFIPLLYCVVLYFTYEGVRRYRKSLLLVAAILSGIGFYAYLSGRYLGLFLPLVLLVQAYLDKEHRKFWLENAGICALIVALIAAPLMYQASLLASPSRISSLTPWSHGTGVGNLAVVIGHTLLAHAGMFIFRGSNVEDLNFGRLPMTEPSLGFFITIGFVLASIAFFGRLRTRSTATAITTDGEPIVCFDALLLIFSACAIFPAMLAYEGIPHPLRLSALILPAFYFGAKAIDALFRTDEKSKWRTPNVALGYAVVLGSVIINGLLYFGLWASDESNLDRGGISAWAVARAINSLDAGKQVLCVADSLDVVAVNIGSADRAQLYSFAPSRFVNGRTAMIREVTCNVLDTSRMLESGSFMPYAVYIRSEDTLALRIATKHFAGYQQQRVSLSEDPRFFCWRLASPMAALPGASTAVPSSPVQ